MGVKEKFIQIQIISVQEGWWKMHANYVWSVASPTYRISPQEKKKYLLLTSDDLHFSPWQQESNLNAQSITPLALEIIY